MAIEVVEVYSGLLGQSVQVVVVDPDARAGGNATWVWKLHGYGNTVDDVTWQLTGLDTAMTAGLLAPHVIAAPVGAWSAHAWWVDSAYRGGLPVQTAVITDVLPAVEAVWGGRPRRDDRVIAGSSMGGAGALNWLLAHTHLFRAAALVAPATFSHAPPARAIADPHGAFGVGDQTYSPDQWTRVMSYREQLSRRQPSAPAAQVAIVVGDAEVVEDYPAPIGRSSLALEAAKLHVALCDTPTISSILRVVDGGHTWDFWIPALVQALNLLFGPHGSAA